MRIAYCTNVRLPTERAHGMQIAAVCSALHGLGHEVQIFAPYRKNPVSEVFSAYYEVSDKIRIEHLGNCDYIASTCTPGVFGLWAMNHTLRTHLPERVMGFDLLYTRTAALLSSLLSTGIPVVLELHRLPRWRKRVFVRTCKRCALVVCLTSPMRDVLVRWGVPKEKIVVEGDAVNLQRFSDLPNHEEARYDWGIHKGTFVVGYAGSLQTMKLSKGAEQIVDAVALLSAQGKNITAFIAGGPDEAMWELRKDAPRCIHFTGQLAQEDVYALYSAVDLLVYPAPNTKHPYFMRDTSPLKIFEYMASGTPMVCADIPPLHDVLDDAETLWYKPGNVDDLLSRIAYAMEHPQEVAKRAANAQERVKQYTWNKRMERILSRV